jgi:hypothetical protein
MVGADTLHCTVIDLVTDDTDPAGLDRIELPGSRYGLVPAQADMNTLQVSVQGIVVDPDILCILPANHYSPGPRRQTRHISCPCM